MRLYTVHFRLPAGGGPGPDRDLMLIKEGFCWPAFFFSFLWALWNRLWLVAAGLFALELAVNGALGALGVGPVVQAAVSLGLAASIGLLANDLSRWTYARRGLEFIDVVAGGGQEDAERRFLDRNPQITGVL
ncbi:MAG TPA: DUF2628 domain-containing protein [Rhodospirillales bacterium]|nr:DUF2628 domain-containing protein [Rhodospirillales bacterium]